MLPLLVALQVAYPPLAPDTSALATKVEVQAAAQAASDAAGQAAAAIAAVPVPASTVPGMETVGGAAGSANTYRRGDAVQPRITRTVAFTTGSNGQVAVTWPVMPAVPLVFVVPNVASAQTQAPVCSPVSGTITTTGATVKCWTTQNVTVSLLGAIVAPLTMAGAGVTGQVLAIPAS